MKKKQERFWEKEVMYGAGGLSGPKSQRIPKRRGWHELEERVLDAEVVEFLAVLEIFGVEDAAIGFEGGGDD